MRDQICKGCLNMQFCQKYHIGRNSQMCDDLIQSGITHTKFLKQMGDS